MNEGKLLSRATAAIYSIAIRENYGHLFSHRPLIRLCVIRRSKCQFWGQHVTDRNRKPSRMRGCVLLKLSAQLLACLE